MAPRHGWWPAAQPLRRLQEPNFNGGAPESAPGQNRASSWHSMRHLADIGIYAIMLAHLTQCVLSMLSICRCAYAHMTITHILQLVLPLPAARPAALLRPCSRVPAHAESSSSCLLRAAGMHISIVLVNVITPTSSLIAAAALLAHSHTHREHAAVAGSTPHRREHAAKV